MEEEKQTTEVRESNVVQDGEAVQRKTATRTTATSGVVVLQRVIWYITGVIVALLALRVVLQLLGANDESGFVSFIYSVSGLFAAPFFGVFSYEPAYGQSTLEASSLVAIAVYLLVGWGLAKLVTITRPHEEI